MAKKVACGAEENVLDTAAMSNRLRELQEAGMIEPSGFEDHNGNVIFHLTDLGRLAYARNAPFLFDLTSHHS